MFAHHTFKTRILDATPPFLRQDVEEQELIELPLQTLEDNNEGDEIHNHWEYVESLACAWNILAKRVKEFPDRLLKTTLPTISNLALYSTTHYQNTSEDERETLFKQQIVNSLEPNTLAFIQMVNSACLQNGNPFKALKPLPNLIARDKSTEGQQQYPNQHHLSVKPKTFPHFADSIEEWRARDPLLEVESDMGMKTTGHLYRLQDDSVKEVIETWFLDVCYKTQEIIINCVGNHLIPTNFFPFNDRCNAMPSFFTQNEDTMSMENTASLMSNEAREVCRIFQQTHRTQSLLCSTEHEMPLSRLHALLSEQEIKADMVKEIVVFLAENRQGIPLRAELLLHIGEFSVKRALNASLKHFGAELNTFSKKYRDASKCGNVRVPSLLETFPPGLASLVRRRYNESLEREWIARIASNTVLNTDLAKKSFLEENEKIRSNSILFTAKYVSPQLLPAVVKDLKAKLVELLNDAGAIEEFNNLLVVLLAPTVRALPRYLLGSADFGDQDPMLAWMYRFPDIERHLREKISHAKLTHIPIPGLFFDPVSLDPVEKDVGADEDEEWSEENEQRARKIAKIDDSWKQNARDITGLHIIKEMMHSAQQGRKYVMRVTLAKEKLDPLAIPIVVRNQQMRSMFSEIAAFVYLREQELKRSIFGARNSGGGGGGGGGIKQLSLRKECALEFFYEYCHKH